jgi:hypothetical protein
LVRYVERYEIEHAVSQLSVVSTGKSRSFDSGGEAAASLRMTPEGMWLEIEMRPLMISKQ